MTEKTEIAHGAGGRGSVETYAAVAGLVWRHAAGDPATALDTSWHAKRYRGRDEKLIVASRDDARAPERPRDGDAHLSCIHAFFDDFALARVDRPGTHEASLFALFKIAGGWRLVSESTIDLADGTREGRYNPTTSEGAVLRALDTYYRGVVEGDHAALGRVLHPDWHMKNLDGSAVYCEARSTFTQRARTRGPFPGYADDRQVADVQIIADRLARVRVDKPSSRTVTVFTFFRIGSDWLMTDKAWSSDG